MAKILLIASKDYNFYNFRSEMILKLHDLGHEVVLSCPFGDKINYFTERGCRFIPHNMDRRGTNILNDAKLVWTYFKLFRKENPDILLTYTGKSSVYGGLVARVLHIPRIINNAGLLNTKYYGFIVKLALNMLYRLGFSHANCMMYQNAQERDYINSIISDVHYRELPGSGVNLNMFNYAEYPSKTEPVIFNYVGRLVRIKGIEEYLKCAERIKEKYPNTKFRIFGDYDDDIYRQRVEELEKKGIVEYCGVKMDMKPFIASAYAAIHPSYYEGMTNVVLEHSAMGRPCLGSNIPGVADGIDDGKTGFLFNVGDVDSLVDAVEKFLSLSYEEKVNMGKNARKKMEKDFDRNIVTNIYIEEIDRIINS